MKISFSVLALFVTAWIVTASAAADTTVNVEVGSGSKPISPDLFGIFFEDLNYAADGGLYAELVQNRSFEYSARERLDWNAFTSWEFVRRDGAGSTAIDAARPIHPDNPQYVVLHVDRAGAGLVNPGFDGIAVKEGESYDFSVFARQLYMDGRWSSGGRTGRPMPLEVRLETEDGKVLAQASVAVDGREWKRYAAVLTPSRTEPRARLAVLGRDAGGVAMDVISLFPQKTFRNRKNGLRADLAQVIADLKPRFVRFPGGCLVHGNGVVNMYRWKDTIGPVEQRRGQPNLWGYHQSVGLGYYEYFQFCEDIGAKPLPVVPAGVSCQNSDHTSGVGQQPIPMEDMPAYIQDVLDLIEWANGPADSEWGSRRAAAGHPEPFGLKYLGVGNEDVISPEFKMRYKMINDAVQAKHPDIVVIGTTGPFTDGEDYEKGWAFARQEKLPMVDEHGYKSPEWFWENLERFDAYERSGTLVYLGEYAAHDSGRANTLRSALAEAAYMTSLERNGDLVWFSSYAPLLSKQGRTQWRPDLIYFDNVSITPSINYYVQQLFGLNSGDVCLPTHVDFPAKSSKTCNGILLGTWDTQARFDDIAVISGSGAVLKESFNGKANGWTSLSGSWQPADGGYVQNSDRTPALSMRTLDGGGSDYTVTLRAMKTSGAEGFLIGFGALDTNNYYWLNLGGWNNTACRIEKTVDGIRSPIGPSVAGKIETNRWYDIKIQVTGHRIQCFLNGKQIIDLTDRGLVPTLDVAASTVRDTQTGDVIVKIVSKAGKTVPATIDLGSLGAFKSTAACTVLTGDPMAENRFGRTPTVLPETSEIEVSGQFEYTIPPHSLNVIRIQSK